MKKAFLLTLIFLICSSFLSIPTKNVVKADDSSESESSDTNIVLYQAVVINDNKKDKKEDNFLTISAISQAYYKDLNNLSIVESVPNPKSLNESVLCDATVFAEKNNYCNSNNKLKGGLSRLTMTQNGDIDLILENGVSLQALNIYYAIAGESNEAQVYCTSKEQNRKVICEDAQKIVADSGMSNWYNDSKDGVMSYTSYNIVNVFDKLPTSIGQTHYMGFNLYENMNRTNFKYSETQGVYVVITYSIKWTDKDEKEYIYNVNDYTAYKKTFDASSVSKTNSTNIKSIIIDKYPTKPLDAKNESDKRPINDANNNLLQNAALIKTNTTYDVTDNKSYNNITNYVTKTIIPIIIIVIGVMFIISGASTAMTIAKSADEPDVRSASIKKLVGMCIGVAIIALILIFYNQIVSVVANLIN